MTEVAHTCARLQDGTAQCWGYNDDGELGNNSPANSAPSTSPVTGVLLAGAGTDNGVPAVVPMYGVTV